MADSTQTAPAADAAKASNAGSAAASASSAAKQQNPALKAMGLPRFRLPSRNWLIFLSITGSFASAVFYDKWQTKRTREKWCSVVSHIASEPLDPHGLPRRLTIYLAAPPDDSLRQAREHFHAYVKPVLVAAAMDWDVIEGRKEGDVRFKTAERVRKQRRRLGEGSEPIAEDELSTNELRQQRGTREWDGVNGDIVVGRHTWKEYIRGLHEGWLGPVDPPAPEGEQQQASSSELQPPDITMKPAGGSGVTDTVTKGAVEKLSDIVHEAEQASASDPNDASPTVSGETADSPAEAPKEEEKKEEKPKRRHPAPYINPEQYETASLSPNAPSNIGPSTAINFPHLLGIRNAPWRFYRFVTRRRLADNVMADVAAAVLAHHDAYAAEGGAVAGESEPSHTTGSIKQVSRALDFEERDWWKTVHRDRAEHEESVWIEPMFIDNRLQQRMTTFRLDAAATERARKIAAGELKVPNADEAE